MNPQPPAPPSTPAINRLAQLKKLMPWFSLVTGVAGAVLMDRGADRAWLITLAALGGFVLQLGLALAHRVDPEKQTGLRRVFARAARFSALAITQSMLQQSLFFALPFYARAATLDVGHVLFVLVIGAAAAATLWDPLIEALLARPRIALALQALASFVALNAVLPVLGLSNLGGLVVAALGTAVATPAVTVAIAPPELRRRVLGRAVVEGLLVPALLLVPAVRRAVPAAPLRLVNMALGTTLAGHDLADAAEVIVAPEQLVCASWVSAPRGLKDAVVHVWEKDGAEVDRIAVTVRGGREEGFRTWSVKKHLGRDPRGTWTCRAETAAGQVLGSVSATVEGPEPGTEPKPAAPPPKGEPAPAPKEEPKPAETGEPPDAG